MRATDIEAVGDLAGEALAIGGAFVGDMHAGIAGRPFGALGEAAAPVRAVHDGVSRAVYAGVRHGLRAAATQGAALLSHRVGDDAPALTDTPAGSLALGVLNGLWGNHLDEREHPLTLEMTIRRAGHDVSIDVESLRSAFPGATPRIAVFLHGLFETDESWAHFPLGEEPERRRTYGERLERDLGLTPVTLRYNSGLRISRNGRRLAGLLDDLVASWPTPVDEIVLVGHSMGGLVARSACHYAERDGRRWTPLARHVFCLGAPHLGSPVEKGVHVLGWAAGRLPETRAFGAILNARSVGIKDLRFGAIVDEDWREHDPDEFLNDRCREIPFLANADYYFVSATLTDGPLGSLVGDLLVRPHSATGRGGGRGRRVPFEVDKGLELSGLTHFDLLNHPAVYEQIRAWVSGDAPVIVQPAALTAAARRSR